MSSFEDPKRWKALAVLGVAYLMVVLDVSIVNVALPSIQQDLDFAPEDLQWVISAYTLTFGGFLLLGGRVGDLLGRRWLFMVGLGAFAVFSLACGLATTSAMLIAFRALQGLAGAVLSPSERNKALGILGAIAGSGAAIGVLAGGVLTEFAGWEWIFFVNVPIGIGALFLVPLFVRESRADDLARYFDTAGAVTVTASLMLLVYGLTQTTNVGWTSARTILVLLGSAILMAAFIVIEKRSRSPLVPLSFFRKRTPTGANIVGFGLGTMVFGMFFLLSLYMQQILGFSALKTGVGYLAVALTAVLASGLAQALVTKLGVKPVLLTGLGLLGAGLVFFTQVSVGGSYVSDLLPGFLLIGVGLGFSFVPVSIAALAGATGRDAGLASGLINTSQQIGGALGLAILSTIATTHAENLVKSGEPAPQAFTSGYSLAFWAGAGFAAISIIAAIFALKREDLAVPGGEPAGAEAR